MSDQDGISPYSINMISSRKVMGKQKMLMRVSLVKPIPSSIIIGIVWQTLKRITRKISEAKELTNTES